MEKARAGSLFRGPVRVLCYPIPGRSIFHCPSCRVSIFGYHTEVPERGLDGGFLLGRDVRGLRDRPAPVSQYEDSVLPFDQGDVHVGDRQAVFFQDPCLDFGIRGVFAELDPLGTGPRFVVQVDIDFSVLGVFAYGKYALFYAGSLLSRIYPERLYKRDKGHAEGGRS